MAQLAAEGHRIRILVGAVAAERAHEEEREENDREDHNLAALARVVQVQAQVFCDLRRRHLVPAPAFDYRPHKDRDKPEYQEGREDYVDEYPYVRALLLRRELYQEEKRYADKRGQADGGARDADEIAKEARHSPRFIRAYNSLRLHAFPPSVSIQWAA
jgi:hypothetical protein